MSHWQVFRWPLAVLSAGGLISALVADGAWDAVSWFGLGLPVAVCAWFGLRRAPVD